MSQQPPSLPSEQPFMQPGQMHNVQIPPPQKKSRMPKFVGIGCGSLLLILALCSFFSIIMKGSPSISTTQSSVASSVTATNPPIQATDTPQPKPTAKIQPTPTGAVVPQFNDGTFEVGKDIKPGTYRTRDASSNCYFARLKGFGGTTDDIIANTNTDNPAIVTIDASDKGFQSSNCGTWTQDLSAITTSKTIFDDGMYVVGTDIEPGTYKNSGQSGCYYARLQGFGGTTDDVIANDNSDTPVVVTISASDKGFQSSNCGTWTKE